MKGRPKPPQRFVYVIGPAAGLQKVGLATDTQSRLAALRTASPVQLVLHAAVPVAFAEAHAVEGRAHLALARHRASGEWFDVTPAEAIAAVRMAAEATGPIGEETAPLPLFAYARPPVPVVADKRGSWRGLRRAYLRVVERL